MRPVRLAAIRLLRLSSDPAARAAIVQLLTDADPVVRFAAVEWVAEAGLTQFRDQLSAGLATGATTRALFEAYLAALERLDGVRRTGRRRMERRTIRACRWSKALTPLRRCGPGLCACCGPTTRA